MKLYENAFCAQRNKNVFNNVFSSTSVFNAQSQEYDNTCMRAADITWAILIMSLLPFWALNIGVVLMSMQGQKAH